MRPRSFSRSSMGTGIRGARHGTGARGFSRASLPGQGAGRPAVNGNGYQFAGDKKRLESVAKRAIASKRWTDKQIRVNNGEPRGTNRRSINTGGDVSALRGNYRTERRFSNERNFYSADSRAEGGSGQSPKNPFA